MGNVLIRGVSALQVPHLHLTRRKEQPVRGKQKVRSLRHPLPCAARRNGAYGGHRYVKLQRCSMSPVYVKQQMVELRHLKCYIRVYIFIYHFHWGYRKSHLRDDAC